MSDWQVGDLAVNVPNADDCPGCAENIGTQYADRPDPFEGAAEVIAIDPPEFPGDTVGLRFACDGPEESWCACGFRKIDRHEACEEEFVTLLKKSKRKVSA